MIVANEPCRSFRTGQSTVSCCEQCKWRVEEHAPCEHAPCDERECVQDSSLSLRTKAFATSGVGAEVARQIAPRRTRYGCFGARGAGVLPGFCTPQPQNEICVIGGVCAPWRAASGNRSAQSRRSGARGNRAARQRAQPADVPPAAIGWRQRRSSPSRSCRPSPRCCRSSSR
jgi:hypothetical protein